jgi:prolyl-tRNA synthetase
VAAALRKLEYAGVKLGVKVDDREGLRPGFKFAYWELRGVPLRIEIGPRDIAEGVCVVAERLSGAKRKLAVDYATSALDGESVTRSLEELQASLYARSRAEVMGRIFEVGSLDEFKQLIAEGRGFVLAPWDGTAATEMMVKELTSATTRCLLPTAPGDNVKCLFSGAPAKHMAYFAASY